MLVVPIFMFISLSPLDRPWDVFALICASVLFIGRFPAKLKVAAASSCQAGAAGLLCLREVDPC